MASVAKQLDAYRPDMPTTASFGLQEVLQQKLKSSHTLDENQTDIEVLYELKMQYLAMHPEAINLVELTKAATPKQNVEVTAGEEFCRLMMSFDRKPSKMVDAVEVASE